MAITDDQVARLRTPHGAVRVRDTGGTGPPVLLIHSLLADPDAYMRLVPLLVTQGRRCVLPELPLGAHAVPLHADADLTPAGLARLLIEVLDQLDLARVDVIGVDTVGALAQLLMANHRDRVRHVILTACDAYEEFPPRRFKAAVDVARLPGVLAAAGTLARTRHGRRAFAPRALTHYGLDDATLRRWTTPLRNRRVRSDLRRALSAMRPSYTLAAAQANRNFPGHVVIAWGDDDTFFPARLADRLTADPHATQITLTDCAALAALDQPAEIARLANQCFGPGTTTDAL